MKKNLLILILAGCSFALHAQQYFPFIEEGKTWSELNTFQFPLPDPFETSYSTITFKLSGDTLEDGKIWKKLFTTNEDPIQGNWEQYYCIYREENGRVYKYSNFITGEELMYDFTLVVGDSVFYDGFNYWFYVIGVDSVEVNGAMHKRIQFDYPEETWVEGLGSTCRPFQPIAGQFIMPGLYSLLCVTNNEGTVYADPAFSDCYIDTTIYTSVSDKDFPVYKVNVYHNFLQQEIRISIAAAEDIFSKYQLYNTNGTLVKQGEVTGNELILNQQILKPGIYLLRLIGTNLAFTTKLVIP